jgi:hypothetical protein
LNFGHFAPARYLLFMNDLERRTLLSAAGIGALAAMSKAGPLNPPAGPVAPTGRTLDEVYNKIPDAVPGGGAGDGRTPILGGTSTVTIGQPGSYVLTGNLTTVGSTIVIAADNVTVDLNGFTLTTTNTGANNVTISGARTMVTVRNGQIAGGFCGVNCLGIVKSVVIEDLSILGVRSVGVMVTGSSRAVTIRRCTITDTGITTVAADTSAVAGIQYQGSNAVIKDCSVFRLFSNQSGVTTFRGISLFLNGQFGSVIERCRVMHDAPITGQGIHLNSGTSVYRDNTVVNFSTSYAVAGATNINGGGNV